ncbi:hypothetical protein L409_05095 [Klebsiella pneumoniae BWH 41]|nr:hypothetical protein L409_05095 [Klebsiella pneumoniae BWH 41]
MNMMISYQELVRTFPIEVMGADRVMFSVDYPYEDIHQACDWFDPLELEAGLKEKIAWGNASRVFNIK